MFGGGVKGNQGDSDPFSIDIVIMYVVALILDISGIILAGMVLTVILAPIAIVLQWILSLLGTFIFTLWIVFVRSHSSGQGGGDEIPAPEIPPEKAPPKTPPPDYSAPTDSSSGDKIKPKPAPKPAKKPLFKKLRFAKKPSPASLLTKKWLKRVGLPWLIESIPIIGKISFTWVLSVYLEQKKG